MRGLEAKYNAVYSHDTSASKGEGNKKTNTRDSTKTPKAASEKDPSKNLNFRPSKEYSIVWKRKVCVRCLKPGHYPGKNQPESCKSEKMAVMPTEWLQQATVEETLLAETEGKGKA